MTFIAYAHEDNDLHRVHTPTITTFITYAHQRSTANLYSIESKQVIVTCVMVLVSNVLRTLDAVMTALAWATGRRKSMQMAAHVSMTMKGTSAVVSSRWYVMSVQLSMKRYTLTPTLVTVTSRQNGCTATDS